MKKFIFLIAATALIVACGETKTSEKLSNDGKSLYSLSLSDNFKNPQSINHSINAYTMPYTKTVQNGEILSTLTSINVISGRDTILLRNDRAALLYPFSNYEFVSNGTLIFSTANGTFTFNVTSPDPMSPYQSGWEYSVFKQINAVRAIGRNCGGLYMPPAPQLSYNFDLRNVARAHSVDMASMQKITHTGSNGSSISARMLSSQYNRGNIVDMGENVAGGFGYSNVVQAWLSSSSHCQTLMDKNLADLGIGYYITPGVGYGTYWTAEFGRRY